MTYIADLDPENPAARVQEANEAAWDVLMPGWQDDEIDREARRFVPENDVLNPDETIIRGYGGDHRAILSYGRDDSYPF